MGNIELLYFCFLEHSFLTGLGVNLSQEIYFSLDDNYKLNVEPIKSVNLFKNSSISNFNLIVGKNGIGKTTVIREIYNFLHGSVDEKKVIVLKKNNTIFIYLSNEKVKFDEKKAKQICCNYDFKVISDGFILDCIPSINISKEEFKHEYKSIAYISNFVDTSTETGSCRLIYNHAFNFSPLALINSPDEFLNYKNSVAYSNLDSNVPNFRLINKIKQIEFLSNKKYEIYFNYPERIKIYFQNIISHLQQEYKKGYFRYYGDLNEWIKYLLDNIKNSTELMSIYNVHIVLGIYKITNIEKYCIDYEKANNNEEFAGLSTNELNLKREYELESFNNMVSEIVIKYLVGQIELGCILAEFDELFSKKSKIEFFYSRRDNENFDLFSELESFIENVMKLYGISKDYFNQNGKYFDIPLGCAGKFLSLYTIVRSNTDIDAIPSVCMPNNIKYYNGVNEFYFSSGQEDMLKTFTYIDMAIENLRLIQGIKDISLIILLDEPTNSLHPELQKEFIGHLKKFLGQYYDCNFHIIMTSHSPIIAGDLTSNHIVFLDNVADNKNIIRALEPKEKPKTFAQNIYNLYRSSFFVKDGLIGTFSDNILINILNQINHKEKNEGNHEYLYEGKYKFSYEEMKIIIEEIGEPLIRNKFIEMIGNRNNKNHLIDRLMNEKKMDVNLREEIISILQKDWR